MQVVGTELTTITNRRALRIDSPTVCTGVLEIDVGERLLVGVADDKAGVGTTAAGSGARKASSGRPSPQRAAQRQNAPPATPETARGLPRALVVLAQQLSSSTSRAFVASPAHHFW
jgi:hypothetical protein